MNGHVVLLGDSIFDNAFYVPGGPSVIEHVRRTLPSNWKATLLAVDGAVVSSVFYQLERLPDDTTHIVLSAGGNNALWTAGNIFSKETNTVREALNDLADAVREFTADYRKLVNAIRELRRPLTLCTVYDSVPGLEPAEATGLSVFNDFISRTAFSTGATLIDLRILCNEASDYSPISPIEPSVTGGGKIARAIAAANLGSDTFHRVIA